MIRSAVRVVRQVLGEGTPIIVRMDAGFFDQKLFEELEAMGIFYAVRGRLYGNVKAMADSLDAEEFQPYSNGRARWRWTEWFSCRAIYVEAKREQTGQQVFGFARRANIIYTNLSPYWVQRSRACQEALEPYLQGEAVLRLCHGRGADELTHRAL